MVKRRHDGDAHKQRCKCYPEIFEHCRLAKILTRYTLSVLYCICVGRLKSFYYPQFIPVVKCVECLWHCMYDASLPWFKGGYWSSQVNNVCKYYSCNLAHSLRIIYWLKIYSTLSRTISVSSTRIEVMSKHCGLSYGFMKWGPAIINRTQEAFSGYLSLSDLA